MKYCKSQPALVNRQHVAILGGGIAVASIGIAIFLYYLFMPAWVYVEVTPDVEDDSNVVTLTNEDMARYPILQRLVLKAESRGLAPSTGIEKTSSDEAIEIANLLQIRNMSRDDRGTFVYNGTTYYTRISYQYNSPGLA